MPESVYIRLQNETGSAILIDEGPEWKCSVVGGTTFASAYRTRGTLSIPGSEYVDLLFDSEVMWSFEAGQIRDAITATDLSYSLGSYVPGSGVLRFPLAVAPGQTIQEWFWAPFPIDITGVSIMAVAAPVTVGAYTAQAWQRVGLAITSAKDLTLLTDETVSSMTLTANTRMDTNELGYIEIISDNEDLAASGIYVQIHFSPGE